jgi:hypothetical protein
MKKAAERIIYNNYDLWEDYAEDAREILTENGEEITDEKIWDQIDFQNEINWEDAQGALTDFFDGENWILFGYTGRWDGNYKAGCVFDDFMKMFYTAAKDCDYVKFWDENGHFYLMCSHHDGTNTYEIRKITDRGSEYLKNWEYNWSDSRTEEYIHDQIIKRYSTLPHFAHKVYGCPKIAYKTA